MKRGTHINKRLFALFLLPTIIIAAILFATTKPIIKVQAQSIQPSQTPAISQTSLYDLSDNELIDYIVQSGIEIPDELLESQEFFYAVKQIVYSSITSSPIFKLSQRQLNSIQASTMWDSCRCAGKESKE